MPPLILASASPQRRALLRELCDAFDVIACALDEPRPRAGVNPVAWACAMACFKARAVADANPDRVVLGADTVIACAGELLGKPRDEHDARRMLLLQAGRSASVITGVALLGRAHDRTLLACASHVVMRDDADERERYLAGGDWRGKAGAYGIQTIGDRLVERLEGSFSNVVGLPLELLRRLWAQRGWRASSQSSSS